MPTTSMGMAPERKLIGPAVKWTMIDEEIAGYRAVSKLAAAALCSSALSLLAMVDLVFSIFAIFGALLAILALLRIRRNPSSIYGRRIALAALGFSIAFAAAAWSNSIAHRWMMEREGRKFVDMWFGFLAANEPQKAHQLMIDPRLRWPLDEHLGEFYRQNAHWREELDYFTSAGNPSQSDRLVPLLLASGANVETRFFRSEPQDPIIQTDSISLVYRVTCGNGDTKSFFARFHLKRQRLENGKAQWWILQYPETILRLDDVDIEGP
jgi:hypothetical protein